MRSLLGGDIVGMTGILEVVLARELGLCYATVALVTLGAGLQPNRLMHQDVETLMRQSAPVLTTMLKQHPRHSADRVSQLLDAGDAVFLPTGKQRELCR